MNAPPASAAIDVMRRAWRGAAPFTLLGVLTTVLGFGLYVVVENGVVIPQCRAYGEPRGLNFVRVESFGYRQESSTHCIFESVSGGEQDVLFSDISSFQTDLLASLALDFEITCPGIAVLLALLWAGLNAALRPHREGTS